MKRLFEKYPVWTVLILLLACLSPLMAMRDYTPANELRYLSIAGEALREGHLFAFFNHGVAYADKPPLYLWAIMLSRILFGSYVKYLICLLSFVPASVIVLVMDKWVYGGRSASAAERAAMALMLFTSALFAGLAVFMRMDMLMTMFIVLALYSWHRDRPWLFALFTFLALFTKGPVGLLAPVLAVLTYCISCRICARRSGGALVRTPWNRLGRWLGWRFWVMLAGLCAIWFTGVYLDGGKEYLSNLLFHQTFDRAVNSFNHKAPFYHYLVGIWIVMFPWCLLAVGTLVFSLIRRGNSATGDDEASRSEKLFRCTVLSVLVVLSCFSSKLNVYLAPIIPFAIYLIPMALHRLGWKRWMNYAVIIPAVFSGLFGVALFLAAAFPLLDGLASLAPYMQFVHSPWMAVAGAAIAAGSVFTIVLRENSVVRTAPLACGFAAAVLFLSPLVPGINDFTGYASLSKDIPAGETVYVQGLSRADNMDVFIDNKIVKLTDDAPVPQDGIYVGKAKVNDPALDGREKIVHGKRAIWLPR